MVGAQGQATCFFEINGLAGSGQQKVPMNIYRFSLLSHVPAKGWGPTWEASMAAALEIRMDRLQGWIEDSTTIPLELEYRLSCIAAARTEEIELAQDMLFQRGINREPELAKGTDED